MSRIEAELGEFNQQRFLFRVKLQRHTIGRAVNAPVVDLTQPPTSHFIEMFNVQKAASIEQIVFYVVQRSFDLTFRFGASSLAGPGLVTIVGGERCEARIVDRLTIFLASNHNFHIVVQTGPAATPPRCSKAAIC